MFRGAITALITPFKDGKIDEKSFGDFVEWQIDQGIDGLVPCGTTGECPTLSHEEHNKVISLCVEAAKGRVPVIAGAGSNSTSEALEMAKHSKKAGANAVLVSSPYYNKPTQQGMYQHFKTICEQADIPLVLYNIPGRSVVDMTDSLIADLSKLDNIVGLKDATGDVSRISSLRMLIEDDEFCYLSGEDSTALAYNAQGGNGVISVTSNIMPRLCSELQKACEENDYEKALAIHEILMPVHLSMFCETSPSPVKYAASVLNICSEDLRLPLLPPSEENKKFIYKTIDKAGLIEELKCQAS